LKAKVEKKKHQIILKLNIFCYPQKMFEQCQKSGLAKFFQAEFYPVSKRVNKLIEAYMIGQIQLFP
jgi:hypothetical protein